jgi:hypothetical protein
MKERFCILIVVGWVLGLITFPAEGASTLGATKIAKFKDASIDESSGLAASKRYPGVFWTHNDQGHAPVLFAVNRQGKTLAQFKVTGVNVDDWEDVAVDNAGNVYISDTGNNTGSRDHVQVYLVKEPKPTSSGSVKVQKTWKLSYPSSGPFNGEAFFISNGYGYLVGKDLVNNGAPLYRFPLSATGAIVLQRVGTLKVGNRITGASVSTDGNALGLISENGAYLFTINGNALRALSTRPFFSSFNETSMEGGTFARDGFLASSERGDLILFTQSPFRRR